MKTAFIFPGQGSQKEGMGKDLYSFFPVAKETFDCVDETLKFSLSDIMFNKDLKTLSQTQYAQPALMTISMAILNVIKSESKKDISELAIATAGHSLGEYSALCAAESLDLQTTALLLKKRGEAFQQASDGIDGGMLAVLGLDIPTIKNAITGKNVFIANDNCVGQTVLSGLKTDLTDLIPVLQNMGAKKAIPLNVTGAFHSPLIQKAADIMSSVLESAVFNPPVIPVIDNVTAKPMQGNPAVALTKQITAGVLWTDSVLYLKNIGVERFVEIGSGTVLTGLGKRIVPEAEHFSIQNAADIDRFLNLIS